MAMGLPQSRRSSSDDSFGDPLKDNSGGGMSGGGRDGGGGNSSAAASSLGGDRDESESDAPAPFDVSLAKYAVPPDLFPFVRSLMEVPPPHVAPRW